MNAVYWIMTCRKCKKFDFRVVKDHQQFFLKCTNCWLVVARVGKPVELPQEEEVKKT